MDLTTADIAQNKAINDIAKKVELLEAHTAVALAMLDKLQETLDELAPVINAVAAVETVVERVEQALQRLKLLDRDAS